MIITWHGHSCFSFKGNKVTVVTDPFSPKETGLAIEPLQADVVTISHDHVGHNFRKGVKEHPMVFDLPGEYEVQDVYIQGIPTYHNPKDVPKEENYGPNTVFTFTIDQINLCHLGDLGHVLTADQVEAIGNVDVLLIPAGAKKTIALSKIKEVIDKIEPRIVIPMHYKLPGMKFELGSLEDFRKALNMPEHVEKLPNLKLTRNDLPEEETKFIFLEKA